MARNAKNDLVDRLEAYDRFLKSRIDLSDKEKARARAKADFFRIDPSDLDREVQEAAAMESYISTRLVLAKREEANRYLERKEIMAQRLLEYREEFKGRKERKTNDEIDALVQTDELVRIANVKHLNAVMTASDIEGDLRAIQRKSRMLELQKYNIMREQTVKTHI